MPKSTAVGVVPETSDVAAAAAAVAAVRTPEMADHVAIETDSATDRRRDASAAEGRRRRGERRHL